ncbi:5-(carboxyamino)imidazole ribonucleotide synthase, partial [Enterococcus faecalis]
GNAQKLEPEVMVKLIGEDIEKSNQICTSKPTWQVQNYGKAETKEGRKMGHDTKTTPSKTETKKEIEAVGKWNVT